MGRSSKDTQGTWEGAARHTAGVHTGFGAGGQIELPKMLGGGGGGQHNTGRYRCTETGRGGGIIGNNTMWGGGGIIQ